MGHLKNCKELRAVAHYNRNNVVMLCLMEETLRFSPKKVLVVTGQLVVCCLGFWCLTLVLSPCGQVGLGHPELKEQSGMLPSTAIDGARAGIQHREVWDWGWFRGGLQGGLMQPGLEPHSTGLNMQNPGQARGSPITVFAASCR